MSPKLHNQIAKSKEEALAAFVSKKAEIDEMLTRLQAFAMKYGLSRDELVYVLDPAKANGPDYPSETFRVLQKNETLRFGEYRTERLVLAAFDRLTGA